MITEMAAGDGIFCGIPNLVVHPIYAVEYDLPIPADLSGFGRWNPAV
jgi:hypothetical protein